MKSVVTHAVLACAALALAWQIRSSVDVERQSGDGVTVVACSESRLASLKLTSESKTVVIRLQSEGKSPRAWIEEHTAAKPTASGAGSTGNTAKKPAAEPSTRRVAAGKRLQRLIEQVAPLVATRSLGEVPSDRLDKLGLGTPEYTLEVDCGGEKSAFSVGTTTYGGSTRYLRAAQGGPVLLVKSSLVGDLQWASSRFMQRELHEFSLRDIERIEVSSGNTTSELLHRDRHNPSGASWVDAREPDHRNELYGNWLARVHQLRALEYLPKDAEPGDERTPAASAKAVVSLRYQGDKPGRLELVKVAGKPTTFYARSEASGAWVTVTGSIAEKVEGDVATVLGVEMPESSTAVGSE